MSHARSRHYWEEFRPLEDLSVANSLTDGESLFHIDEGYNFLQSPAYTSSFTNSNYTSNATTTFLASFDLTSHDSDSATGQSVNGEPLRNEYEAANEKLGYEPDNLNQVQSTSARKPSKPRKKASTKQKPPPPESYIGAAQWPEGLTKPANAKCLTCIRYNRQCSSTTLHYYQGRPRCHCCAKKNKNGGGSRICAWANKALGVRTYEDGQRVYPFMRRCSKKTVEGKQQRGARRRRTTAEIAAGVTL